MQTGRRLLIDGPALDARGQRACIEVLIDEPSAPGSDPLAAPVAESWVLLPSSLRDARDLDGLASILAMAGCRVLRPMPRGMGRSTGTLEDLTLHALADDVATVIRTLGNGRPAILVGHAFGHFVARVTDLDHPDCVAGIAIVAAAARTFPPAVAGAVDQIADLTQPEATRLAWLRRAFFADGNDPSAWLNGWYPDLGPAYRSAGKIPDKSDWWPVSQAPILDLQAADDPWRPASSRHELKTVLGDRVTVQVIDGASHALPFEKPEAVAAAMLGWRQSLLAPISGR